MSIIQNKAPWISDSWFEKANPRKAKIVYADTEEINDKEELIIELVATDKLDDIVRMSIWGQNKNTLAKGQREFDTASLIGLTVSVSLTQVGPKKHKILKVV